MVRRFRVWSVCSGLGRGRSARANDNTGPGNPGVSRSRRLEEQRAEGPARGSDALPLFKPSPKGVEALLGSRKLRVRVRADGPAAAGSSSEAASGSEEDRTSTKDPSDPTGELGAAGWPLGNPKGSEVLTLRLRRPSRRARSISSPMQVPLKPAPQEGLGLSRSRRHVRTRSRGSHHESNEKQEPSDGGTEKSKEEGSQNHP